MTDSTLILLTLFAGLLSGQIFLFMFNVVDERIKLLASKLDLLEETMLTFAVGTQEKFAPTQPLEG